MADPTIAERIAEYGVTMDTMEMQRNQNGSSLWHCRLYKSGYDPEGWLIESTSASKPTLEKIIDDLLDTEESFSEGGDSFIGYLTLFSTSASRFTLAEITEFYRSYEEGQEALKMAHNFFGALEWFDLTENTQRLNED